MHTITDVTSGEKSPLGALRNFRLRITYLRFRTGPLPITWLPIAPHSSPTNMTLSVPIYYILLMYLHLNNWEFCRVNSEDMTLFMLSLIFYGNVLFLCVALDNRCILILIFKSVGRNVWIISSMFHLMKTKKCCINVNETTLQKSNYLIIKQQYITVWPPTISESYWTSLQAIDGRSIKVMILRRKSCSMRACQDCKCPVLFIYSLHK
jgi:hypothetical protein